MAFKIKNFCFPMFALLLLFQQAQGQSTSVEGYITEEGSGEPVMFASVVFKGTYTGATSDTTGYFKLTINTAEMVEDTLLVSLLGYFPKKIPIKRGEKQTLEITLKPSFMELSEITILAGEDPAWALLRKVIDRKPQNNPDNQRSYQSREYSKVRFDLNHFTDKIKKNIVLKPFDYIWENTNETEDGVKYLPVLLVEKSIDHYYQSSPRKMKDIVQGVSTTGLAGPKLMQFVEDLYITPNIYENFVVILGKSFPSPINDSYRAHYHYYLTDSLMVDGAKQYRVVFVPRMKRSLAFTGDMLIDSATYGVKEVSLRFDIMANVNFVRSYWVRQEYDQVSGEHWMLTKSQVLGDFTVLENVSDLTGFFGRKNSTFSDYKINEPINDKIFRGVELVENTDSATLRSKEFWEKSRMEPLAVEEVQIFDMVERVKSDPKFIARKNIALAIFTGYIPMGSALDLGDLYTFYSYNQVERSRLKVGFRTNRNLDFPVEGAAHLAYGTYDEQWKYGLSTAYTLGKNPKNLQRFGISYKYDIEQLSRSFNHIELDHVLTSFIQIGSNVSRNYVTDFRAYFEKNITTGLTTRLSYFNNTIAPTEGAFSLLDDEGDPTTQNEYNAAGLELTLKFSYLNRDLRGAFYDKSDLVHAFRKYPDLAISWQMADRRVFNSEFDYQKLKASLRQQVRAGRWGFFEYNIEGGKTFGTVPYPYLDIPFGNQLVLFDDYAFNLMNFLEYAADEYVAVHFKHHFEGLIMDRIPLVNKLKWRSFVFGKGYFGRISDENNQEKYLFPVELTGINEPYYEAGFGFENIFKIARMDFIWRLTEGATGQQVYYFIVKPSFKLGF